MNARSPGHSNSASAIRSRQATRDSTSCCHRSGEQQAGDILNGQRSSVNERAGRGCGHRHWPWRAAGAERLRRAGQQRPTGSSSDNNGERGRFGERRIRLNVAPRPCVCTSTHARNTQTGERSPNRFALPQDDRLQGRSAASGPRAGAREQPGQPAATAKRQFVCLAGPISMPAARVALAAALGHLLAALTSSCREPASEPARQRARQTDS
jgi:hypothetical protein